MPALPSSNRMDAEEYLERCGVTAYLKDVVTLMLENQPPNPLAFMAHYFQQVTKGSSALSRAYRYIRLAEPEQQVFRDNLVAAFHSLESRGDEGFVAGSDLLRLLRLLGSNSALDVSRSLLALLNKSEGDAFSFCDFSIAVRFTPSLPNNLLL